jgi:hypothetical protein
MLSMSQEVKVAPLMEWRARQELSVRIPEISGSRLSGQTTTSPLGRVTSLAHMIRGTGEAERMPEGRFLMTRRQTRRVEVVRPGSDPAASRSVRPGRTLVYVAAESATVPAGVDSREA